MRSLVHRKFFDRARRNEAQRLEARHKYLEQAISRSGDMAAMFAKDKRGKEGLLAILNERIEECDRLLDQHISLTENQMRAVCQDRKCLREIISDIQAAEDKTLNLEKALNDVKGKMKKFADEEP